MSSEMTSDSDEGEAENHRVNNVRRAGVAGDAVESCRRGAASDRARGHRMPQMRDEAPAMAYQRSVSALNFRRGRLERTQPK